MSDALGQAILDAADRIERELGAPVADPSIALRPEHEDPLIHQLVYSMLLWESSHEDAAKSLAAICAEILEGQDA